MSELRNPTKGYSTGNVCVRRTGQCSARVWRQKVRRRTGDDRLLFANCALRLKCFTFFLAHDAVVSAPAFFFFLLAPERASSSSEREDGATRFFWRQKTATHTRSAGFLAPKSDDRVFVVASGLSKYRRRARPPPALFWRQKEMSSAARTSIGRLFSSRRS